MLSRTIRPLHNLFGGDDPARLAILLGASALLTRPPSQKAAQPVERPVSFAHLNPPTARPKRSSKPAEGDGVDFSHLMEFNRGGGR